MQILLMGGTWAPFLLHIGELQKALFPPEANCIWKLPQGLGGCAPPPTQLYALMAQSDQSDCLNEEDKLKTHINSIGTQ